MTEEIEDKLPPLASLEPRKRQLPFEVDGVSLSVEELKAYQWEGVVTLISGSWTEISEPLSAFFSRFAGESDEAGTDWGPVVEIVQEVLGRARFSQLIGEILANPGNAEMLGLKESGPRYLTDDQVAAVVRDVRALLTLRQAMVVLETWLEVEPIQDLLGNVQTLAGKLLAGVTTVSD